MIPENLQFLCEHHQETKENKFRYYRREILNNSDHITHQLSQMDFWEFLINEIFNSHYANF